MSEIETWMSEPFLSRDMRSLLESRLPEELVRRRLHKEWKNEQGFDSGMRGFFELERAFSFYSLVRLGFRLSGLHRRGQDNSYDLRVVQREFCFEHLPVSFDGYRILQISDPHLDLTPRMLPCLMDTIQDLAYDCCVITGDIRARRFGDIRPAVSALHSLMSVLRGDVYAVLGNHDSLFMLPAMEGLGISVLMNEAVSLWRGSDAICLVGVDDPHDYQTADLDAVADSVREGQVSLLLAHTPEVYRQAADAGFDLMLCGHTHGGQICLPGGFPLFSNADCPRRLARGAWQHERLTGYTSCGSGASLVDLRLNCPPEVTLHTLRRQGRE